MFVDSHIHLNDKRFTGDIEAVLARARQCGIGHMINVGSDIFSSSIAVKQAERFENLYAAVGVHPHSATEYNENVAKQLEAMLSNEKVVAWGEIGLDYHYDFSPRDIQKEAFKEQLEIALMHKYPVIIHNRESHNDMINILKSVNKPLNGVMHCFSGSVEFAKQVLDLGLYISFAGPVTFKNARKLPEVIKYTPIDRMLIETDCPYLSPVPYRGKRNEPAYVIEVAKKIAEIKELNLSIVAKNTTENAIKLFRLGNKNV